MVICPDCGKMVPDAKFCKNCGAPLPKDDGDRPVVEEVEFSVVDDVSPDESDENVSDEVSSILDGAFSVGTDEVKSVAEETKPIVNEEVEPVAEETKPIVNEEVEPVVVEEAEAEVHDSDENMVICPDCGQNVPSAKFCKNCGATLPVGGDVSSDVSQEAESSVGDDEIPSEDEESIKFCHACGFEIEGDIRYCPNCGADLYNSGSTSVQTSTKPRHKNIIVAIVLSVIFPGLGQFYLGLNHKGLMFLIGYIISAVLILLFVGLILCFVIWIWALVDAIQSTNALNRGEDVEDRLLA